MKTIQRSIESTMLLEEIQYILPNSDKNFSEHFLQYLSPLGKIDKNKILFNLSQADYYPKTSFVFSDVISSIVVFLFDNGQSLHVELNNITGITKKSPHTYAPLAIDEFIKRVEKLPIKTIDHTGFNLPYFTDIHPRIVKLREELKATCLYHTFPKQLSDVPWDFILPATKEEIQKTQAIDYQAIRRPKIEIVSFSKSSTPLIQIDIQVEGSYEDFIKLFPEAIFVEDLKNLWIYVKNDFGIDICFVLNEVQKSDWSHYFKDYRII